MGEALKKFSVHISKETLVANGGTPSLQKEQYSRLSPAEKARYNMKNGIAVAAFIRRRRSEKK
jgi:hypothetical protein